MICKILGVPLADEPKFHGWIADMMAGAELGPDAATEEGQRRKEKGVASRKEFAKYIIGLVESAREKPRRRHDLEAGARRRPGRTHVPQRNREQLQLLYSSPVMTPRST